MYNDVRLHSAISYLAPCDKLAGRAEQILAERDRKLAEARERRRLVRQQEHERRQCQQPVTDRPAIDFAAVRAAVSLAAVLQLLGFEARTSREAQQRGACPLHGSGSGTSRCFSANLDKNLFQCFKCGRSGNALDLWAQAQHLTPYDAALDLCQRLNVPVPLLSSPRNSEEEPVAPGPTTCTMEST